MLPNNHMKMISDPSDILFPFADQKWLRQAQLGTQWRHHPP